MFKEAHTISYIQQASHKWIEGDEEETAYAQAIESLKVVPTNIQHRPDVLQRFKVAHEPLVKALSSFENKENHGELIKPLHR
jgi:radical SAM superfamily enzyme